MAPKYKPPQPKITAKEIGRKTFDLLKSTQYDERNTGLNQLMRMMGGSDKKQKIEAFRTIKLLLQEGLPSSGLNAHFDEVLSAVTKHIGGYLLDYKHPMFCDERTSAKALQAAEALINAETLHALRAAIEKRELHDEVLYRSGNLLEYWRANHAGDKDKLANLIIDPLGSPYRNETDITRFVNLMRHQMPDLDTKKLILKKLGERHALFRTDVMPREHRDEIMRAILLNVGLHHTAPDECDKETSQAALNAALRITQETNTDGLAEFKAELLQMHKFGRVNQQRV